MLTTRDFSIYVISLLLSLWIGNLNIADFIHGSWNDVIISCFGGHAYSENCTHGVS